ncbi:hypothetical protein TeGR_g5816, partial [Tetraparma gracilis]
MAQVQVLSWLSHALASNQMFVVMGLIIERKFYLSGLLKRQTQSVIHAREAPCWKILCRFVWPSQILLFLMPIFSDKWGVGIYVASRSNAFAMGGGRGVFRHDVGAVVVEMAFLIVILLSIKSIYDCKQIMKKLLCAMDEKGGSTLPEGGSTLPEGGSTLPEGGSTLPEGSPPKPKFVANDSFDESPAADPSNPDIPASPVSGDLAKGASTPVSRARRRAVLAEQTAFKYAVSLLGLITFAWAPLSLIYIDYVVEPRPHGQGHSGSFGASSATTWQCVILMSCFSALVPFVTLRFDKSVRDGTAEFLLGWMVEPRWEGS